MKDCSLMLTRFTNEPLLPLSAPGVRETAEAALDRAKAQLGRTYPLVIDGVSEVLNETISSINPSRPSEVVGRFSMATPAHADQAIAAATVAFETWRLTSVQERARILLRVAGEMRRRKADFDAIMMLEVGKTWAEAEADVSEAIDFVEYYARQALRITDSSAQLAEFPGEQPSLRYIPLGVGAIIPPWNFPCAIPLGMTAAALVMGNTVVLKPAEQSMWIAYAFCELLWAQHLPPGVLNFLTGPGETVGARLVEHPGTRFISFTGSRAVGTQIYEIAARVQPGQRWLKRSILEMGGKDAIVVDETADLEAAARGIVASAFGFQGQKCSACSRAIIVDSVYEQVAERVVALAGALTMGSPDSLDADLGPVIDADAFAKISEYIAIGRGEATLLLGHTPTRADQAGYFIAPTIFGDVSPKARIAQEEIFGPVLALIRARDYQTAIAIANDTEYGLTGAVYTASSARLEYAREHFHVGNLYLNRKCTGAMVGVHPFGGFNMSGTDSKAGGPDYLLLYSQAKSISERL
jgi:1-pyrroline-5-carboxylate dehydrogenase